MTSCCGNGHDVVGWRLWDDRGRVFSRVDGHRLYALPNDGILVLMLYYADGRKRILHGADWYFIARHAEGPIFGSDTCAPDPTRYDLEWVGRGRWAPDHVQADVEATAMESTWP